MNAIANMDQIGTRSNHNPVNIVFIQAAILVTQALMEETRYRPLTKAGRLVERRILSQALRGRKPLTCLRFHSVAVAG